MNAGVDVEHEGVEMRALLLLDCRGGEERIHQHAFAAPDAAVDVKALRWRAHWDEPKARAPTLVAGGLIGLKFFPEKLQPRGGALLHRIGRELARRQPRMKERKRS